MVREPGRVELPDVQRLLVLRVVRLAVVRDESAQVAADELELLGLAIIKGKKSP